MIDVYFWTTPNGYKVTILLEELGWKYNVIPINIGKGEQFRPDFLAVSPNNRIPALVDDEPKAMITTAITTGRKCTTAPSTPPPHTPAPWPPTSTASGSTPIPATKPKKAAKTGG